MHSPTVRRAVSLLPKLGTTGIGSLPHTQLELALQTALQVDIPYLPQLPQKNPSEFMIASALDGLPGLTYDDDGVCTVDTAAYRSGSEQLEAALHAALDGGQLEPFLPSPQACRAFQPFLWEVEHRKLALVKAQLAGPCTVRWVATSSDGAPTSAHPALDQQIFRLLLAKGLALAQAFRRAGATPLIYLDEPGLYALQRQDPRQLVALQELKVMVLALQRQGALVGVHCCSNTAWELILELGVDLVSLDVRLSLDALLENAAGFRRFLASGATLSLGVVPTDVASAYRVEELVDSVEASLRATLGEGPVVREALGSMLLTPACGLAMRSVPDAERIFEELKLAQRSLRTLAKVDAGLEETAQA